MKAYFDTSVLVAASVDDHPSHGVSFHLVASVRQKALWGCISQHVLP